MSRDHPSIEELIERSSLGTPEAKRMRERTSPEVAARIVERANELRREREQMTMSERERWQGLDRQASPGPWTAGSESVGEAVWLLVEDDDGNSVVSTGTGQPEGSNLAFIAAARMGWPAAERECDQLRALLRKTYRALAATDDAAEWERVADALLLLDQSGLLDDEGQQP